MEELIKQIKSTWKLNFNKNESIINDEWKFKVENKIKTNKIKLY